MNIKLRAGLKAPNTALDIITLKYASKQTALTTQELILSYLNLTYLILPHLIVQQNLQQKFGVGTPFAETLGEFCARHHTPLNRKKHRNSADLNSNERDC